MILDWIENAIGNVFRVIGAVCLCVFVVVYLAGDGIRFASSDSGPYALHTVAGECYGSVCRIGYDEGGELGLYLDAAGEVLALNRVLIIDGPCYSACAVLADMARPRVCITDRAHFGFHQAAKQEIVIHDGVIVLTSVPIGAPPHSADVDQWVETHGGYPTDDVTLMNATEAAQFWPMCQFGY